MPSDRIQDFLPAREAADIIGVTMSRLAQMRREGKISAEPWGERAWMYPRKEVERVAQEERKPGRKANK